MKTFSTKAFLELPDADEMRSNGSPVETFVLFNDSDTIQLEAVQQDIELFEQEFETEIDSDVIKDDLMASLIEFLNQNRRLGEPV